MTLRRIFQLVCTFLVLADGSTSTQVSTTDNWGGGIFRDISKLTGTCYADYNKDHIIFYPTSGRSGSPDFNAVVGPPRLDLPFSFQFFHKLSVFTPFTSAATHLWKYQRSNQPSGCARRLHKRSELGQLRGGAVGEPLSSVEEYGFYGRNWS